MGDLPAETRLGAIRLRVGDVDSQRGFYERAIGLATLGTENGVTALGVEGAVPLVELLADPDAPARPPHTTGLFHLALLTPSRHDLAHALRRVIDAGWRLSGASDHLVSEALSLSDPEGNGLELYRDRPRDEWPRTDDGIAMATLPLDLDDLLRESPGGHTSPRMAPGTTLGHVHLQVGDLAAGEAFWVDAFGFDIVARLAPSALFVSAGGYHHHLGLNTWAGVGAPRPPEGARGLVHFEVVLPGADEVDDVGGRLSADRVDGRVVAADPSGNAVLVRS